MSYKDIDEVVKNLYDFAKQKGGIEYIYTLLRLDGINYKLKDEFIELDEKLNTMNFERESTATNYQSLVSYTEPLRLLVNLLNCVSSKSFISSPFISVKEKVLGTKLNLFERIKLIKDIAKGAKFEKIDLLLNEICSESICKAYDENKSLMEFISDELLKRLHYFLKALLNNYSKLLLNFRDEYPYIKLPNFEVLELLINDDIGLYGFKVHFSNGTHAIFERHPDRVEHTNLILHPRVNFFVGNLKEIKYEWMVGDKRLYEIGLKGRYNKLGEWKPIIFPGKVDKIQNEVKSISDDIEIQGILFYIVCTGYKVIEFVMKSPLNMPIEKVLCYDNMLFIHKNEQLYDLQEDFVYDCWFKVSDVDVKEIEKDINSIKMVINRLGISFGAPIRWCFKYSMTSSKKGHVDPSTDDMNYFGKLLSASLKPEDTILIEAEDWYNQGKISRNPFISFMCFYNSIENLAINISQGKTSIMKPMVKNKKENKKKCIEDLYKVLYKSNPVQFVNEAYENCVMESNRKKVEYAFETIFGTNNSFVHSLFHKVNEYSLYEIRNKIAHGVFSLYDKENINLVRARIGEIEYLSKEFILRILLDLQPDQVLPEWSEMHSIRFKAADPRDTLYASTTSILGDNDWRIRPEWCE